MTIRLGPTASLCSALWACGSHLTQSQWARFCSRAEHRDDAAGRGSGRPPPSRRSPGRATAPAPRARTPRCRRRPAGRCSPAGWAGCGAPPAAGAGRRPRRGRPGRSACCRAAPGRPTAAGRRGRSARAGSRVAGRVLPDPRALLGQGGQRGRLGVVPGQGPALLVGGLAGDLADPGQVAEVLRAGAGHLLGALLPLPVELDDDEAEGGEQEHPGGDVAAAAAGPAHGGHEHDRPEAAEHRDGVHQHAAGALGLLDLRRRLELDAAGRHLGFVVPRAPKRRAHRTPVPSRPGSIAPEGSMIGGPSGSDYPDGPERMVAAGRREPGS